MAGWILWSISDWGSDVELVEDMLKSNDWNLTCRFSRCVGVETVALGTDHLTCRGGYGFLFRSEFFLRTTQELEYLFFLSPNVRIFFPELNIRLYDKNSESDYFFFLYHNQNIFFSNIGNQNIRMLHFFQCSNIQFWIFRIVQTKVPALCKGPECSRSKV